MQRTVIVLPDGSELISGTGTVNAIQSVSITQCVNDSQELTLGSVCANMLEATLITPAGGLSLNAGDTLTVYREDGKARHRVGVFLLEKPTRPSAHTMKLTAYDYITKLDRDLTGWLAGLTAWPYTLYQLAGMVCDQCGLTLVNEQIPNGDHPVKMFSAEGITGRQLMKWIGEAAGRFCRATADGEAEFAWYTPAAVEIGPKAGGSVAFAGGQLSLTDAKASASGADGNVTLTSENITVSHDAAGNVILTVRADLKDLYYFQNGLRFEDYAVAPIEKVQIRQSSEDVGTVYPNEEGQKNTYIITGNSLLTASAAQDLQPIAYTLYEQLRNVSYTPCSIQLPGGSGIEAGNTVTIIDSNGKVVTAYVMTKKQAGQRDTLECTGSQRRDSTTAVNNQTYKALSGKVLNLRTDVDGLKVENADAQGKVASLKLELDAVTAKVENTKVGGVNLLVGTNNGIDRWKYSTQTGEGTKEEYLDGDGARGVKLTCVTPSTGWQYTRFRSPETLPKLQPNTGYTVGFDLMTNVSQRIGLCIQQGDAKKQLSGWGEADVVGDGKWHKITMGITTNELTEGLADQVLYIAGFNVEGYYIIKNLKMEIGNVATDWSPAPEDVRGDIDAAKELVLEEYSKLSVRADGITASVAAQIGQLNNLSQQISSVEQTAGSIAMRISQVEENGTSKVHTETGYTFDKDGLRISKSGQQMENLLDNTGMYVKRSGNVLLQANDRGVEAVDVTIRNYLIVGDHSRFEDYNGGTGCFWI